ncbi:MAG TPA: nitroreductase family deazaflavin-dependent oxidoreductase [Actinomycetota bacterium]|nr:nitroreductase family deazaflavin-dependent oxidoreductase [Actinomycetota bacterium]
MTDARGSIDQDFAYLTTTGRRTGSPHRIEIWFALHDDVAYLLSGGGDRSDWVKNLTASPTVVLEIGGERRTTTARLVTDPDEDALARRVVVDKYRPRSSDDLTEWGRTSVPVAIAWAGVAGDPSGATPDGT